MKRFTMPRHLDCERRPEISRRHKAFDRLGGIECSTHIPDSAPLRLGEIAVKDARTGREITGVEAARTIVRGYLPFLPLPASPVMARNLDAELRGCQGKACGITPVRWPASPEIFF